jgi:hypothetical protein
VRFLRWLYSGYDWPLYRDWLAWVALAITAAVLARQVQRTDAWVLLSAPIGFAFYGWILGAVRNVWRGYHERSPEQRRR